MADFDPADYFKARAEGTETPINNPWAPLNTFDAKIRAKQAELDQRRAAKVAALQAARTQYQLDEATSLPGMAASAAGSATRSLVEGVNRLPNAAGRWYQAGEEAFTDGVNYLIEAFGGDPEQLNQMPEGVSDVVNTIKSGARKVEEFFTAQADAVRDLEASVQARSPNAQAVTQTFQEMDTALDQALAGNPKALVQTLQDPRAWAASIGMAAPSLVASMMTGGSLKAIAVLEGLETANDVAEFERQTGEKISPQEFARAQAQVMAINGLLEKAGLDRIISPKTGGLLQRAGNIAVAGAAEGLTETGQALNSNLAARLNYDPERSLTEGVLPGLMGGAGTGAGMRAGVEAVTPREQETDAEPESENTQAARDRVREASKTGNTEGLTPFEAIQAKARRARQESTPQAERQKLRTEINELATRFAEDVQNQQRDLEALRPERLEEHKARITELTQQLEAMDAQSEEAQALKAELTDRQSSVEVIEAMTPKQRRTLKRKLEEAQRELSLVESLRNTLQSQTAATPQEFDALLATLTGDTAANSEAETAVDPVAVSDEVIRHAMVNPDLLSPDVAETLANNPALTESQREVFRTLSQAQVAANAAQSVESVQNEIFRGNKKRNMRGLEDYRQSLAEAIQNQDVAKAERDYRLLSNFAESHQNKAAAIQAAQAQIQQDNRPRAVARIANTQEWEVLPQPITDAQQRAELGAVNIYRGNSDTLAKAVAAEAQAIEAARSAYAAGLAYLRNSPAPETASEDHPEASSASVEPTPATDTETNYAPEVSSQAPQAPEPSQETAQAEEPAAQATRAREGTGSDSQVAEEPAADVTETTDTVTDSSEPLAAEATPELEVPETPASGQLSVFTSADDNNLVVSRMVQKARKANSKTERPLVAVKDFFSQLQAGDRSALVQQYAGLTALTEKQQQLLNTFVTTLQGNEAEPNWLETLRGLIPLEDGREDTRYNKYMQYLVDRSDPKNPQLDENLLTAMAASLFQYLADYGDGQQQNSDEAINRILGRPDDTAVSPKERELFATGERVKLLEQSLGRQAAQLLGLEAKAEAPDNTQAQLEGALGAYTLALGMELGLLERFEVKPPRALVATDYTTWPMVRVYKPQGSAPEVADRIFRASKGTQNFLDQFLGTTAQRPEPTLTPQPYTQSRIRGTDRGVPKALREANELQQQRSYKARGDLWHLMQQFQEDVLEALVGVEEPGEFTHVANRASIQGRNQGLQRELNEYFAFMEALPELSRQHGEDLGFEQPIYLQFDVWRPQRAGILNYINPQMSKAHRSLFTQTAWETKVPTNPQDPKFKLFLLQVAQGLGVAIDKKRLPNALQEARQLLYPQHQKADATTALYTEAVELIRRSIYEDHALTEGEQYFIQRAVKEGGEALHSLDALTQWAHYQQALKAGHSEFTVEGFLEVDGVNNGPILALLEAGGMTSPEELLSELERGGFYTEASGVSSFAEWRDNPSAKNRDLYEDLVVRVVQAARRYIKEAATPQQRQQRQETFEAIFTTLGAFTNRFRDTNAADAQVRKDGRNAVKNPLTTLFYGSAPSSTKETMAENFIAAVYEHFEQIAQNYDLSEAARDQQVREYRQQLKAMLVYGDAVLTAQNKRQRKKNPELKPYRPVAAQFNTQLGFRDSLAQEFTAGELAALQAAFKDTLGDAVTGSLRAKYQLFLDRRQTANQAANAAFTLYHEVETRLREQRTEEKILKGELPTNAYGQAIDVLSREDEQAIKRQLRKLAPVVHTRLSKQEGQLQNGLLLAKQRQELTQSGPYTGKHAFAHPVKTNNSEKKTLKSLESGGMLRTWEAPGVASFILSIHSMDSSISHETIRQFSALNLHDAHANRIDDILENTQELNRQVFEAALEYSPFKEHFHSLERTVNGFFELQDSDVAPAVLHEAYAATQKALYKSFKGDVREAFESSGLDPLSFVLREVHKAAVAADRTKFAALAQVKYINQYALEGGSYVLTEVDQVRIQKAQAAVEQLDTQLAPTLERAQALASTFEVNLTAEEGTPATDNSDSAELTDITSESDAVLPTSPLETVSKAALTTLVEQVLNTEEANSLQQPLTQVLNQLTQTRKSVEAILASLAPSERAYVEHLLEQRLNTARHSGWGEWGIPRHASNPELVRALELQTRNGQQPTTVGKLFGVLARQLPQGTEGNFQRQLLHRLRQTVDATLPVHYITARTEGAAPAGLSKARGYYEHQGEGLIIKSPDFVESGVTAEFLLHELVHASLTGMIQAARQGQGKPEARRLLQELELLRQAVEAHVASNPQQQQQFAPALKNVDEFLAWGLSNAAFQRLMAEVEYTGKTPAKSLRAQAHTAAKRFLQALVKALFPNKAQQTQAQQNALGIFIADTALLFEATAALKNQGERVVHAYEDATSFEEIDRYTSVEILEALEAASTPLPQAQHTRLVALLEGVTEKLFGAAGIYKEQADAVAAGNPGEVWWKAQRTGRAPFTSDVLSRQIRLNDPEAFVVENLEAVARVALDPKAQSYRELRSLYAQAKARITPAHFEAQGMTAEAAEQAWQAAFTTRKADGSPDPQYLARFMALGLAWQPLHTALAQERVGATARWKDMSLTERLHHVLDQLLRLLRLRTRKVFAGQPMEDQLQVLVEDLVDIAAKRKHWVKGRMAENLERLNKALDSASRTVRDRAVGVINSPRIQESDNTYVQTAGKATSALAEGRADHIYNYIRKTRDRLFTGRDGVVMSLLNELVGDNGGHRSNLYRLLRQGTKRLEVMRKRVISETEALLTDSFESLTEAQNAALTHLLRLDLQSLFGEYDFTQLTQLVADSAYREQEIQRLENSIKAHQFGAYYLFQGENLGYFLATNRMLEDGGMLNAHNILHLYETGVSEQVNTQEVASLEPVLDRLISLYALRHTASTRPQQLKTAVELMRQEAARTQGNGVEVALRIHQSLLKEARESLFENDPAHFYKGYLPEIHNPYRTVKAATEAEGIQLLQEGWVRGAPLSQDPLDGSAKKHLYVLNHNVMQSRVTGILSNTGDGTRGSLLDMEAQDFARIQKQRQARLQQLIRQPRAFNPNKKAPSRLVATVDSQGAVKGYRYLMSHELRDTVLERDNRFERNLGLLAGRLLDKQTNTTQNRQVIKALHQQYLDEFDERVESYVEISANSPDPESREAYRLLPETTKQDIRDIWGERKMWVRRDQLNLVFGYRKRSLANAYVEAKRQYVAERTVAQRALVGTLTTLARMTPGVNVNTLPLRLGQAEAILHEIAMMVKDFWVIKNPSTLLLNFGSMVSQLMIHRVPMAQIVKGIPEAVKATLDYQRDQGELIQLQRRLASGLVVDEQATLERMAELEQEIAKNPMKPLVDAGMMQTIVEDIDPEDESFTYKNKLLQLTTPYTDKLPRWLRTTGKTVLMTHDTPLYKFMHQSTTFVDLAGRYVLHNWQTTREDNPLSEEESFRRIYEEFVAYDVPQHPLLQYLEDHGALRFTRYYVRIQKIILRMFRENPGRALQMVLLGNLLDVPHVIEGNVLEQAGVPLKGGPFDLPDAVPQAATFQGLSVLLQ